MKEMTDIYFGIKGVVKKSDEDDASYEVEPAGQVIVYSSEKDQYYYDLLEDKKKYPKDISLCHEGDLYVIPSSLLSMDEYLKRKDDDEKKAHDRIKVKKGSIE